MRLMVIFISALTICLGFSSCSVVKKNGYYQSRNYQWKKVSLKEKKNNRVVAKNSCSEVVQLDLYAKKTKLDTEIKLEKPPRIEIDHLQTDNVDSNSVPTVSESKIVTEEKAVPYFEQRVPLASVLGSIVMGITLIAIPSTGLIWLIYIGGPLTFILMLIGVLEEQNFRTIGGLVLGSLMLIATIMILSVMLVG